ncbi:MAG: hypothetical protein ACK4K0_08590 [Flavobacteriales bacterium]
MRKNLAILSLIGGVFSLIPDLSMWSFLGNYLSNSITEDAFQEVISRNLARLSENGFRVDAESLHRLKTTYLMLAALDVVAMIGAGLYLVKHPLALRLYVPAQLIYVVLPFIMVGLHFNNIRLLGWADPLLMIVFISGFIYFNNKQK